MSKIIQLTPCADWYFVEWDNHKLDWLVSPVAAWGLTADGEVLGMLPVAGLKDSAMPMYPHLVAAPATAGKFSHVSKLTEKQLKIAQIRPT